MSLRSGGVSIGVVTEDFGGNEDRSWLGSRLDNQWMPRSNTIAPSSFDPAHFTAKGALPSGMVLALFTGGGNIGLLGPYTPGGANGLAAAVGHLFNTTKVGRFGDGTDLATAPPVGVPLFWAGIVKQGKLPTFSVASGMVDAAAKTALGNFIRYEA